jgi:SAM-dependent methyltransferase
MTTSTNSRAVLEASSDQFSTPFNQAPACRFCAAPLTRTFVDLGMSPMANSYVKPDGRNRMEPFFPLHAYLCEKCFLVQLEEFETPASIFTEYAYFSSFSESWLEHAKRTANTMVDRFQFGSDSQVVEIASNDGYLLQFYQQRNVRVMGIEPAANVAETARQKGIPTLAKFFGVETATEVKASGIAPDLLIAVNVMPHVPNLNDFVGGLKILLKPGGVLSTEFQYFVPLVVDTKFDTIYHEHFSYLSFFTTEQVLRHHGLQPFDVEELPTHGGSIRILSKHMDDTSKPVSERVEQLRNRELAMGVNTLRFYEDFPERVKEVKRALLEFLIGLKRKGMSVAAYGAPAKGNTLLNYCGIGTDFIDYTVDLNPAKQNHYLPGTHIPIYSPERLKQTKPDYLLILPWNLKDEIAQQTSFIRSWGGKHVVPIPTVKVLE